MPSERVLVCGAGVSGSVLAFWLAKYDFEVVVVERSRAEQKSGQGIEIEEPALQVVKAMGIIDTLKRRRTGELGFTLLNQHNQSYGTISVNDGFSPTGELEIMRGDLTEVLYKAADEFPNVTYHFDTTLQTLRQTGDKVIVELETRKDKSRWSEEFDFVIGADGVKSRTRQLVMGSPEQLKCMNSIGAFVAYFSIPKEDRDWPNSRMCHFPDRRNVWLRPISKDSDLTTVYLIWVHDDSPVLRQANAAGDRQKQKEAFAEVFSGLGWETPRVIKQMMTAENFYSDELSQVKLQTWSEGRVALVGDAAWAPTPFTGEGNQLAIIGAWILAQEMSRNRSVDGFKNYETRLRPYVVEKQSIPLWGYAPYLCVPQTAWGIWFFQIIFQFVAWMVRLVAGSGLLKLFPETQRDAGFDMQMNGVASKKTQ